MMKLKVWKLCKYGFLKSNRKAIEKNLIEIKLNRISKINQINGKIK